MKHFSVRKGITYAAILVLAIGVILAALKIWGGLELGDVFSFGQLLVEILLIPAAILAFIYTIHEIREAKEESRLNLVLSLDGTSAKLTTTLEIQVGRAEHVSRFPKHLQIYVLNSGTKVAVWWRAKIRVPLDLYDAAKKELNPPWVYQFGDSTQWTQEDSDGHVDISFISRGEHPSYPGYPQHILRLITDWDKSKEYIDKYVIPYEIYTESSGKSVGELNLKIARQ